MYVHVGGPKREVRIRFGRHTHRGVQAVVKFAAQGTLRGNGSRFTLYTARHLTVERYGRWPAGLRTIGGLRDLCHLPATLRVLQTARKARPHRRAHLARGHAA
jgi:hypothetical protein